MFQLKTNVIIEPLINCWHAQLHCMPPATYALRLTKQLIPALESYLAEPGTHETAWQFDELIGGDFLCYQQRETDYIIQLLSKIKKECNALIAFSRDIDALQHLIIQHNDSGLEETYNKLPQNIRPFVELYYDAFQQANFRFFENMLYKSKLYEEKNQSIVIRSINDDNRLYCQITPKKFEMQDLHIKLPFRDQFYDKLFSTRIKPISQPEINSLYSHLSNHSTCSYEQFIKIFTKNDNCQKPNKKIGSMNIRYFGHACLLIETIDTTILIDPIIPHTYKNCSPRFSYNDLPDEIDYLLISHSHHDHVQIEHLIQLRSRIKTVVVPTNNYGSILDPSLKLFFHQLGFSQVIELRELENITHGNTHIITLPFIGEHGDLAIYSKTAFLIQCNDKSALCAVDLDNINEPLYQLASQFTGKINALFISVESIGAPVSWLYKPYLYKKLSSTSDAKRSLKASNTKGIISLIKSFHCEKVYVYAMGQEKWLSHILHIDSHNHDNQKNELTALSSYCAQQSILFKNLLQKDDILWK